MLKVEKASRKLRKERKNRAKKVCVFSIYHRELRLHLLYCISSVEPKSPRLRSLPRRGSKVIILHGTSTYACPTLLIVISTRPSYAATNATHMHQRESCVT